MKKTAKNALNVAVLAHAAMLHVGAASAEGPRVGERFGDWTFECTALAESQTECALSQVLMDGDRQVPVAKFSLNKDNLGEARFLIAVLPLGIDATMPISARIDQGKPTSLQLLTCLAGGCIARLPLDPAIVKEMKGGMRMSVFFNFVGSADQTVFPVSLAGVTKGFAAARLDYD